MNRSVPNRVAVTTALFLLLASATLRAQLSADTVTIRISRICAVENESVKNVSLFIAATPRPNAPIDIRLRAGGTAAAGEDHGWRDTIMRIDSGGILESFVVPLLDDAVAEEIEFIHLEAEIVAGPARMKDTTPTRIYLIDDETPPTNLLRNPGFEEDTTAWQRAHGGGVIVTDTVYSGTRALRMDESDTSTHRLMYQEVAVMPGMPYLFQGELMGYRFITAMSYVQMEWFDGDGESLGRSSVIFRIVEGGPEWNHSSNCIVAPERAVVGRLILATPSESDNTGSFWFDDLGLYPFAETTDVGEGRVGAPRLDLSMRGE